MCSWVSSDHRIAAKNCLLTTSAAKWATIQVGTGRTVLEVAKELNWNAIAPMTLLPPTAKRWPRLTRNASIAPAQLGSTRGVSSSSQLTTPATQLPSPTLSTTRSSTSCPAAITWTWLIFSTIRATPTRVASPRRFGHAQRLCGRLLGDSAPSGPGSRSLPGDFTSQSSLGPSETASAKRTDRPPVPTRDPLYRVRRTLLVGKKKLDERAAARLGSLLALGDPNAEVAVAHRKKERLCDLYRTIDATEARAMLEELKEHCLRPVMPPEIQKLGRTIWHWFEKICNFHLARIHNGPTEAINNLIKRIKRVGFGFGNFQNYRIRTLLYAGKPNWRVLGSIVVR